MIFYFNKLINFIYFKVVQKLFKKHSTSFNDEQVLFFKVLKSNFFFGGGAGLDCVQRANVGLKRGLGGLKLFSER